MSDHDETVEPAPQHPAPQHPAPEHPAPELPGPPPPLPDLAAVSASVDPPASEGPRVEPPRVEAPAVAPPALVRPTPDVAAVPAASRIPGAPAPGYGRLPTAPVAMVAYGPSENDTGQWPGVEPTAPRAVVGPWALGLAIVALAASLVVGWMLPLGLTAIIVAIVALRRPVERRSVGTWALVLAGASVLYSAGWLLWAAWRAGLVG
jgi:hypothetical protein